MSDNEQLRAENKSLKEENSQLRCQLEYLKKQLFGTGKSEKLDPLQRELLLGQIDDIEKRIKTTKVPEHERTKKLPRESREERYEHLPVEETIEVLPEQVEANPDAYERTSGQEETFELGYHVGKFFRRRIVRPKFRKKADRSEALVVACAPFRLVSGLISAQLLAFILVSKYVDHLPLHRQAKIFKRQGCKLSAESMVRWTGQASEHIKPIYDQMSWQLLNGNYLQADETPVTFIEPDRGLKKSKKGYFCVYTRPGDDVVYVWRKGRTYKDVTGHLESFEGLLQTDAYGRYIEFAQQNENIVLLGCMAHCRRKFVEALNVNKRESEIVIRLMARLYKVEKEIRESNTWLSELEISEKRQQQCSNTLKRLKRVFTIIQQRLPNQQPARKAADYAMNHWQSLCEYVNHGQTQIDNNLVENAIRPSALGKKNWLFIGHPDAGARSAIIYSIVLSCERAGLNPQDYLTELLSRDLSKMTEKQLSKLTPHNYAKSLAQSSKAA